MAEIGLLNVKADGSLAGKLIVKKDSTSEWKAVAGSYIVDASGFGALKISTPGATDSDGGTVLQTTTYIFAITAKQELIAMRTDNSLLGLARITPAQ